MDIHHYEIITKRPLQAKCSSLTAALKNYIQQTN